MAGARSFSPASVSRALDAWLTAPARNAAGRVGLFRIIFALFYLWEISRYYALDIALWPGMRHRVLGLAWFPADAPSLFFVLLESLVVVFAVLLLLGYRTRWATGGILVAGTLLEALLVSLDARNSTVLLVFFIPLFMSIGGSWGDTYSLDARIQRQRTGSSVPPATDDGFYFMPVRSVLVVLSLLFLSGSLLKMLDGGSWLSYPRIIPDLMLRAQVDNAMEGLALNPLAPIVSDIPALHPFLRYGVLAFEGLFWLVLFGPRLRAVFVSLALLFHSSNAIWMNVTFAPILIVYLMLVDWELIWRRAAPSGALLASSFSTRTLEWGAWGLALLAGLLWQVRPGLRDAVSLGGLVDEVTLWYPVLPVALVLLVRALLRLLAGLFHRAPAPGMSQ